MIVIEFTRENGVVEEPIFFAQKVLELDVQVRRGVEDVSMDVAEQEGESGPVHVQHTANHVTINHLQQVRNDDGVSLFKVTFLYLSRV